MYNYTIVIDNSLKNPDKWSMFVKSAGYRAIRLVRGKRELSTFDVRAVLVSRLKNV